MEWIDGRVPLRKKVKVHTQIYMVVSLLKPFHPLSFNPYIKHKRKMRVNTEHHPFTTNQPTNSGRRRLLLEELEAKPKLPLLTGL